MSLKNPPPSMPFDVGLYMRETAEFGLDQKAVYVELMCQVWANKGEIPLHEKALAKALGLTLRLWRKPRFQQILDLFEIVHDPNKVRPLIRHPRFNPVLKMRQERAHKGWQTWLASNSKPELVQKGGRFDIKKPQLIEQKHVDRSLTDLDWRKLEQEVRSAYAQANTPLPAGELPILVAWREAGFKPEIILAVIRSRLVADGDNPQPHTFDRAVEAAHKPKA